MKNKKWLVILFAAMLAVLAACGGNNQSEGKDEKVLKVGATGQS
ncbi:amino acid ABC transporter substrate-binding protein, partial [Bacillus pumilus]|nr:amino acid ABC transporter substrate-binding protein [Bacillus pumilus]